MKYCKNIALAVLFLIKQDRNKFRPVFMDVEKQLAR